MANAPRDENNVPTWLGTSSSDGVTTIPVKADPTTHTVSVNDSSTGTDLSGAIAPRDENLVTAMLAVSETDGLTPVPVYVDTSGNLLIDSS